MPNDTNEVSVAEIQSARQKVFDPMEDDVAATVILSLSATVGSLSPEIGGGLSSPGIAFLENVTSTIHTTSLLYNTLFGNILMERYGELQQVRRAEAEARFGRLLTEEENISVETSALSDLSSPDHTELIKKWTLRRVNLIWDRGIIAPTGPQVLRQGVVLLWGAFEVLCNDLLIVAGNIRPNLLDKIAASDDLNRKRGLVKSDWGKPELWPRGKEGIKLNSLNSISAAYHALFPSVGSYLVLSNPWFADQQLIMLEQRRHIIVHRAGVKDQAYLTQSSDTGSSGDVLEVSPSDFLRYTKTVIETSSKILQAVDAG